MEWFFLFVCIFLFFLFPFWQLTSFYRKTFDLGIIFLMIHTKAYEKITKTDPGQYIRVEPYTLSAKNKRPRAIISITKTKTSLMQIFVYTVVVGCRLF